jgi:PAS domain S-box-containing protein
MLPSTRHEPYLVRRVNLGSAERKVPVLFLFNAERLFRIERSAKLISYLNLVVIGFAVLLGFYFVHSTLRPLRVLMQTAKSAPAEISDVGSGNDSDFLIGTFKGVITKLKEKEQELNRLHQLEKARADDVQQLNQDLLRSITSGLILIDQNGKIRVFNQAAESILKVSRLIALNQPYAPIVQKYSPALSLDIKECFDRHEPIVRAEMEIQTPRNGRSFISAGIMPLQDRQQKFSGVFCIFSDITEFVLLQQHMAQKEKFASLGEMAAGVAHEFRNSLATIAGYVQLMEDKVSGDEKTYTAPINKELGLLQKIVNDFLSFAKPAQPHFNPVDLEELVHECAEEARISAKEIDFKIDGEFFTIPGDEIMLRQIFNNLLRNAVEALRETNRKGLIRICGEKQDQKTIVVRIQDNGSGIQQDDLERIFTPFYSTKQDGVGLGLAIVQKLVLSHNGSIDVSSTSEGTTFTLHFPI